MFWATITNVNDDAIDEIATIAKRDVNDERDDDDRAIIVSTNRDAIAYVASIVNRFDDDDDDKIVVNVFDDSIYEIVDIARRESIDFVAYVTIDENDDDTYVAYIDFYEYARVEFFVDTYTSFNVEYRFDVNVDTSRSNRENARLRFAIEREFANAREIANVRSRKSRRSIVERYAIDANASNVSREYRATTRERRRERDA